MYRYLPCCLFVTFVAHVPPAQTISSSDIDKNRPGLYSDGQGA